jgi:sugar/nucleoside kinase (ribokinase family)
MEKALRYANAVGALTATKMGVIPALPTAAEVEAFLKKRGY